MARRHEKTVFDHFTDTPTDLLQGVAGRRRSGCWRAHDRRVTFDYVTNDIPNRNTWPSAFHCGDERSWRRSAIEQLKDVLIPESSGMAAR
jgi:hypothetical protein